MIRSLQIASAVIWTAALAAAPAHAGEPAANGGAGASEATPPDASAATPAADMSPRWASRAALVDGAYRSGLSRGKLDFGLKFDAPLRAARPGEALLEPVVAYLAPAPTLSVGLRSTPVGTVAAAGSLLERATGATIGPSAERKVGLEWKPAQSRVFLNRGVGIRLDGEDRITMRLKKGSLGLYMQSAF